MKRKLAVFTIMQDEPVFGPIWLDHYMRHVGHVPYFGCGDDIYLLEHKSDDASRAWVDFVVDDARSRINVVPVHRTESFNHNWLRDTVAAFQRFLLQSYEWVLFVESDELVLPANSMFDTLRHWLTIRADERPDEDVIRAEGYEVVGREDEPAIDWTARPLLAQRRWWYHSKIYSKPCLSRVPLDWEIGFHSATQSKDVAISPDLTLVHLHKADFGSSLAKARAVARRRLSKTDVDLGWGFQNYEVDEEKLRRYFRANIDTVKFPDDPSAADAQLVAIPDAIREAI